MSAPCAPFQPASLQATVPMAVRRPAAVADPAGRHRGSRTAAARLGLAVDAVAKLGSLVTLSALLVLAGAAGGLVDGVPTGHGTTVTVTFDGAGH
jgi:hypothetical protein